MISDQEKIEVLINRLYTIEFMIKSFIDHAEEFKNKYSLEEELLECESKKVALIEMLEGLGWTYPTLD
jgi:hypothetical protein